jgi:hypothetical protein
VNEQAIGRAMFGVDIVNPAAVCADEGTGETHVFSSCAALYQLAPPDLNQTLSPRGPRNYAVRME